MTTRICGRHYLIWSNSSIYCLFIWFYPFFHCVLQQTEKCLNMSNYYCQISDMLAVCSAVFLLLSLSQIIMYINTALYGISTSIRPKTQIRPTAAMIFLHLHASRHASPQDSKKEKGLIHTVNYKVS